MTKSNEVKSILDESSKGLTNMKTILDGPHRLDAVSFLNGEIDFINYIREHKEIGFGRMIQIIQDEWIATHKREYGIDISDRFRSAQGEGWLVAFFKWLGMR